MPSAIAIEEWSNARRYCAEKRHPGKAQNTEPLGTSQTMPATLFTPDSPVVQDSFF